MRYLLNILLLLYPFSSFLLDKEDLTFNRFWGISVIVLLLAIFIQDIDTSKRHYNTFYKTGVLMSIFMLVSVVLNQRIQFIDYYSISKYTLAFFVAGAVFNYNFSLKHIKKLFKINRIYLFVFSMVIFYRIIGYGATLGTVTVARDELWFGRPVFFSLFYSVFALSFILESLLFNKNKILKYLVFIPVLFLGARSVLFGFLVVLMVIFINDLNKKYKLKTIVRTGVVLISSLVFVVAVNIDQIYQKDNVLFQLVASEGDANRESSEFDVNTFSSGRVEVIDFYFQHYEVKHIFLGLGGLSSDISIGLHNDFLDLFFLYGIFTVSIFIYFYLFQLLLKILKLNLPKEIRNFGLAIICFFLIQNLSNPFIPTLTSIYFFILLILFFKIQHLTYRL